MAEHKFQPMTKDRLNAVLEQQIKTSVGYYDSKLSKEREKVLDYYNAVLPKPHHQGNSKYVSMDVYDAVESAKAFLLETFAAGRRIVSFEPLSADDVVQAKVATDYCDHVVFTQNDGYQIFSDSIQDGLMARVGVAKVYWDEKFEQVEEEFSNLTPEEVSILQQQFEEVEAELNEETGLYDGSIERTEDKSQVRIDVIPPEEFLINPQAPSLERATFVCHRTRKTRADLIKEGYDISDVKELGEASEIDLTLHPEVLARFESIGADRLNLNGEIQEQTRYLVVYECYLWLDFEGDGITKLYRIVKAGNSLIDEPEEVDHIPFVAFRPLPQPHAFYGSNFGARVIPTQNARTVLTRSILDHTLITNNPRYQVVKGALVNPKEMLENRLGGLVNVTRPDGLMPLPQPSLNPFVFQTIQLLDEDKEETTGISKLSQGINKDAVSKQNSQAMVENLVSLSQQRQKIIARNFANQFVKPLYLLVYRLINANEKKERVFKVAGNFLRISPAEWKERSVATVEMRLGYGEQEREAQKYIGIHTMLSQDPGSQPLYGLPNKYAMLMTILEKGGVPNAEDFLTHPDKLPPPQPDPMVVKQMQLQEKTVAIQERQVMVGEKKVEMTGQIESMSLQLQDMKNKMEAMAKQRDLDRRDFEARHMALMAEKEFQAAKAAPESEQKGIFSPNS